MIISCRSIIVAFNPNPTPEQLRTRERNRRYLQKLDPEKLKALNERKKIHTKNNYLHYIENDPDFILQNRENALNHYHRQMKKSPKKYRKKRQEFRKNRQEYYEKIKNRSLGEPIALPKKQWTSRDDLLNEMLYEDQVSDKNPEFEQMQPEEQVA